MKPCRAEQGSIGAVMACNCILNLVFGELRGKAIGGVEARSPAAKSHISC